MRKLLINSNILIVIIFLGLLIGLQSCSDDDDNGVTPNNSPTLILGPKPQSTNYDYDAYGRLDRIEDENGDLYVDYHWAGQMLQGYDQYIQFQNIGEEGVVEINITLYENNDVIQDSTIEHSVKANTHYVLIVGGEADIREYNPRHQLSIGSPSAIATDSTSSTWSRSSVQLYRTIETMLIEE